MSKVDVQTESEQERGWSYCVRLQRDDGSFSEHTVALAWVDHEHWCGGRCAPSKVVETLLRLVIDHGPRDLPAAFDAARARRWWPEIDRELREAL